MRHFEATDPNFSETLQDLMLSFAVGSRGRVDNPHTVLKIRWFHSLKWMT